MFRQCSFIPSTIAILFVLSLAPLFTPAQLTTDSRFPMVLKLSTGSALVYQPQISSWDQQKQVTAWSAVLFERTGTHEQLFGTIKFGADTSVSLQQRMVNLTSVRIDDVNFDKIAADETEKLKIELTRSMTGGNRVMPLENFTTAIDTSELIPRSTGSNGLSSDPPRIFYSSTPAILVGFDGKPIWSPIKNVADLKFAANCNWDVFEHAPTKTFFLRNEGSWYKAADINGPWSPAGKLPASFSKIPADENWRDVVLNLPGRPVTVMPKVFVSLDPAEFISVSGTPKYLPVTGTSLQWLSNTESDVFRNGPAGLYYYLVAGRWFSSSSLEGPWKFATLDLPPAFKKIPVDHPRSRVLASVPGTGGAAEGFLMGAIPQRARVHRYDTKAPEVTYPGGRPTFFPIRGTSLEWAANADKDIIKFLSSFYMCYEGVWFTATFAAGPWAVALSVPDEIYKIPPESPLYHVAFVKIIADENAEDEWVSYATLAGYTGMMVAWGTAVWETGYAYPPYVWYDSFYPYYPYYYWYPRAYGYGAWYNPFTGTFGRGALVYGPFGGAGAFAAYNPRTGTYARGAAIYGAYGSRGFAQAWNPRTGTYGETRQGSNIYGNWGATSVKRGDDWVKTGHVTNYAKGTRTSGIRGQEAALITRKGPNGRTTIAKGQGGKVYAGHDGSVYRKQNGEWQKWTNSGWNDVGARPKNLVGDTPRVDNATKNQLDRDKANREKAAQRSRDLNRYNPSRSTRMSAGSFRGFGGGFRGGGRRR